MCRCRKTKRFLGKWKPVIYILKQIGIVFFLCHRLSVPGVLLTLLPWWLPLSGSLLCTKAPGVTESYYTIRHSGNGMMCNDVVFYFLSCIIWAHLTCCSSYRQANGKDNHIALWCKFGTAWKLQTHWDTLHIYRWVMLLRWSSLYNRLWCPFLWHQILIR